MGLFSNIENTSLGTNYDVPADESYTYPNGFARIMSEAAQNDLNLFSALIARDFEEAAMIQEGYGGFSEEVITEGVTDIFKKIKEMFLKLLAKIKGIFKSFMAKFDSVFMKDSKDYYEKYKKYVNAAGINWSDFKCKVQMPKKRVSDFTLPITEKDWNDMIDNIGETVANFNKKAVEVLKEDDKALINLLNLTGTKISEASDFDKEFHELYFDDEETIDEHQKLKDMVEPILYGGEKYHKTIKKDLDMFDRAVKKIVNHMDKIADDARKKTPTSKFDGMKAGSNVADVDVKISNIDGSDVAYTHRKTKDIVKVKDIDNYLPFANAVSDLAHIYQNAATKIHVAFLNEVKFEAKQARSIYAALVAYALKGKNKTGSANEGVESLIVVAKEAAEYEFDSDFELA